MSDAKKFGELRLSAKGTNNGRGFDILYDFGTNHESVEFTSKREFYFIQPWMQFPSGEYTDECMRVSIELVHRFNTYDALKTENERLKIESDKMIKIVRKIDCCTCVSADGDNPKCHIHHG